MRNNRAVSIDDEPSLRVLTLDGGGVRGLSSLYILRDLMRCVNEIRAAKGLKAVQPHELFDLIAGTSTGGLITIMLGRLRMSVDDCITVYQELCKEVFKDPQGLVSRGMNLAIKRSVPAKFSTAALKKQVLKVLREQLSGRDVENELLMAESTSSSRVFVCATSTTTTNVTTRLRSYPSRTIGEVASPTILQAALATSAATGFFDPVEIDGEFFVDGALSANNPVLEAFEELKMLRGADNDNIESEICTIVSIGTGHPGLNPFSDHVWEMIRESIIHIATETERTALRFHEAHRSLFSAGRAFRFNVIHGLRDVGLDEWARGGEIRARTRAYLNQPAQDHDFRLCAQQLATHASRMDKLYLKARKQARQCLRFWWLFFMIVLGISFLVGVALLYQSNIYEEYMQDKAPGYYQENKLDSRLPIYAVLGVTGVGKSSFIATVGGKHIETGSPPSIGHQLQSHTDINNFYRFDSLITGPGYLIDTPGIDESNRTRTDTEIMKTIENSLTKVQIKDKMLMGLIFLYDIHQPRAYGSILNALDTTLDMMEYLLGTNGIAKITLVTTKWTEGASQKQRTDEEERERLLRVNYWQGPLSCNSEMARYYNTKASALNIIARLKERERIISRPKNGCRTVKEEPKQLPAAEQGQSSHDSTASSKKKQSTHKPGAAQDAGGDRSKFHLNEDFHGQILPRQSKLWRAITYFFSWIWPLLAINGLIGLSSAFFVDHSLPEQERYEKVGLVVILCAFAYLVYWIGYEITHSVLGCVVMYHGGVLLVWVVTAGLFTALVNVTASPDKSNNFVQGVFVWLLLGTFAAFAVHLVAFFFGHGTRKASCTFLSKLLPLYGDD